LKLKKNDDTMKIDSEPKDQMETLKEINADESFMNDPGLNPSGQYDLVAVLTHVGRGANSGHYIGWVKDDKSDNWCKLWTYYREV
jgi:ubiquitin carboxyl-terminal hydrolase 14